MIKKIIVGVLVAIVVFVGWGWYAKNDLLKDAVNTHGPGIANVPLTLGAVNLSPFSGEASMSDFVLGQPKGWGEGDMVKLDSFSVKIRPETITDSHVIIDEIIMKAPRLLVRVDGKRNNFQTFADSFITAGSADEPPSDVTLTIHKFAITDAVIQLEVEGFGASETTIKLADIELNDIGTDEKGQTPDEIARHLSSAIQPQITKAITSSQGKKLLGKLTGSDGTEQGIKDTLKKGLGGLLKKDDN